MSGRAAMHEEHRDYEGAKIGMWLFLFTEVLLFGGMFLLYSVFRSRFAADFHEAAKELHLVFGAVNTVVLLTSSLTMALAISAIQMGRRWHSIVFQAVTMACAIGFLVNKYFEWGAKIGHDIYPGSETMGSLPHGEILFYSLYFVMTGLHGVHVLVGLAVLLVMFVLTIRGVIVRDDFVKLENAGLYWHLVDLVWIYLFPLFYLIT